MANVAYGESSWNPKNALAGAMVDTSRCQGPHEVDKSRQGLLDEQAMEDCSDRSFLFPVVDEKVCPDARLQLSKYPSLADCDPVSPCKPRRHLQEQREGRVEEEDGGDAGLRSLDQKKCLAGLAGTTLIGRDSPPLLSLICSALCFSFFHLCCFL